MYLRAGKMAEWSIAAVLKTVELKGSGGSNPSLSATISKSMETNIIIPNKTIENAIDLSIIQSIHEIRGYKVMLDFDLAEQYGVETKRLKEAVRRNIERFEGEDCMFELIREEIDSLRCQFGILNTGGRGQHSKYLPFAFTELGIAMLSSVLNSEKAIKVNKDIMRAFVAIRQYVLNYNELKQDLEEFKEETRTQFDSISEVLDDFVEHKKELEKPRNPIGFKTNANLKS